MTSSDRFRFRLTQRVLVFVAFATSAILGASIANASDSIRCQGRLLLEGDTSARLLALCGEPLSKDVVAVERAFDDGAPVRSEYAETWTYPAPNTDGFQSLRFEAGKLVSGEVRCDGSLIRVGDTTASVRERCGAPLTRDSAGLQTGSPGPAAPSTTPVAEVLLEQWIYDRGAGKLQAIVVLRGGRIAAIESGRRQ